MKITITLKPWTWECGDGCCSDSGLIIEYSIPNGCKKEYESGSYYLAGLYVLPVYILCDILYENHLTTDNYQVRDKFCEILGYNPPNEWFWAAKLPHLNIQQINKIAAGYGIEIEFIVEECFEK